MLNYPCQVKEEVKRWIRDYFEKNGKGCFAVIGISGGKDSSVAATLCAEALGKDRVVGVLMPNGIQSDIEDAKRLVEFLEIPHLIINIGATSAALCQELEQNEVLKGMTGNAGLSKDSKINLPARIRMTTLYAVAQSLPGGGRVVTLVTDQKIILDIPRSMGILLEISVPFQIFWWRKSGNWDMLWVAKGFD